MHPLRLALWKDFTEVEDNHLQQHLTSENVLLISKLHIRDYQGTVAIALI